jgi:hypothetical protein
MLEEPTASVFKVYAENEGSGLLQTAVDYKTHTHNGAKQVVTGSSLSCLVSFH